MRYSSLAVALALLCSFGCIKKKIEEARRKTAHVQTKMISESLDLYKLSQRQYPKTLSALTNPISDGQPVLPELPLDPWDHPFIYAFPGVHNKGGFDLSSAGPDGVAGNDDDITNWSSP